VAKLLEVKNLQTQFLTSAGVVRAVDGEAGLPWWRAVPSGHR
jgi:hypothetical protein